MRPKARGLAQHGGLPGWPEERNPAVSIPESSDTVNSEVWQMK
jgi:hypothetical protein